MFGCRLTPSIVPLGICYPLLTRWHVQQIAYDWKTLWTRWKVFAITSHEYLPNKPYYQRGYQEIEWETGAEHFGGVKLS